MIDYEQVKQVMINPPSEGLVELYNDIEYTIKQHPMCVKGKKPFGKLGKSGSFCISATSIQTDYIAFVLGKAKHNEFPKEIMDLFFGVDYNFKLQYGNINGEDIDGCMYLIHEQSDTKYDLQSVYDCIYSTEDD